MRLYAIGPVTGLPGGNRAAFEEARRRLEAAGHEVRIPHDFVPPSADWQAAMRVSIAEMLSLGADGSPLFDGVAELPGARRSKGASIEGGLCRSLGVPVLPVDAWIGKEARDGGPDRG